VSVAPDGVRAVVQRSVDEAAEAGLRLALFPEGPYCAPLPAKESCRQRHADPGR